MAMYQAKQTGRNNFQFYCPQFAASTMRQLAIEQQLREALSAKTFYLHFQPVIHLATREIVSVEALLRWQHNEIGPDLFVPVAEATGLINPISAWLLEQACRQYKEWIAQGLDPIPIAVNVSAVEFRANNFVGRFKEVLRQHGIPMSALQLELTETSMMDDLDHAAAVLCQLKSLGVTVLLDDFGTGHSSLAYLARLPLNKVKIDKSFISGLETDLACRAVTDAMITLGRTVNLEVVAEGIESANMLDYVCAHGCTQAQGYFLGRPMSGDDFALWYREREKNSEARNYKTLQSH
jgi:EAL domain-containing protein (putative c-di-GMP-specific phosphodiesterase class I)